MTKYDLGSNYEDSFNSRKGSVRKSALDFGKLDNPVNFYKAKEGFAHLDIVPYPIKSSQHPYVKQGKRKVGDFSYNLDIYVHKKIGPGELTVICPAKTYQKACPICDAAYEYKNAGKMEEYSALKAKRMCYYNLIDADHPDEGLKVWEYSHYLFEAELIDEARNGSKDGNFIDFANPVDGYTIECRGVSETNGGFDFTKYKAFKFEKRNYNLEKYVPKTVSFDELITVLSSDQLMAVMNGVDEEVDEERDAIQNEKEGPIPEQDDFAVEEAKEVNPCPYGHQWNKDNDETPDCADCAKKNLQTWKDCARGIKK